jgi:hypothetical protein
MTASAQLIRQEQLIADMPGWVVLVGVSAMISALMRSLSKNPAPALRLCQPADAIMSPAQTRLVLLSV